jgi:hypothetical protein
VLNPCLDAHAVCGPNKLCVVNAEARKNPLVWCRACFDLEADKAKLCAKTQGDADVTQCEKTVDDTARSCDQDKCAQARLALEGDSSPLRQIEQRQREVREVKLKRYEQTQDWFERAAKR